MSRRITPDVITRQLLRLSVLRQNRDLGEVVDEIWASDIEMALRSCATDDAHVARIVDAWVRKSQWRPMPCDIYETSESLPAAEVARPNRKCASCAGTGWQPAWQLVTRERGPGGWLHRSTQVIEDYEAAKALKQQVDGRDQTVYDCVRRCSDCDYGQRLAAAEAARRDAA